MEAEGGFKGSTMPKKDKTSKAEKFEKRVRSFLKRSGFQDVNGGNKFFLGRNQIDACGGIDGTLLMVECKTRSKNAAPLLDAIRKLRGQIDSIRLGAKENQTYRNYRNFRFVIATNFDISRNDRKEAQKGRTRKIYLWNRSFTAYYDQLAGKIGEFTKYSILGELGVNPNQGREERFPCIRGSINRNHLYFFLADPRQVLKWAYVARREVGHERYYQRLVESKKLQEICRYVQDEGGYFPNAIILAINGKTRFVPFSIGKRNLSKWAIDNLDFGVLYLPAKYRSCWIIDGQHRLYGVGRVKKALKPMPVVALERPPLEHQAHLFLEINENQKPVPADLVWDLRGEMQQSEEKGIIARIAKELNRRGVLQNRIYIPLSGPRRKGQIKLSGICTAIYNQRLAGRVLKDKIGNPLYREDPGKRLRSVTKSLNLALKMADRNFEGRQKKEFWYQNSGIAVLLALIGKIIGRCKHVPTEHEYRKYLKALKGHLKRYKSRDTLKALRQRCNSEGGRQEVVAEFCRAISREIKDPKFGEGIPEDKYERRIKQVERGLADLVAEVLSQGSLKWFVQFVPEDIRNRVQRAMHKEADSDGGPQDFMTFGDVVTIIKRSDNLMKIKPRLIIRGGFNNFNQFEAGASIINDLRGRTMHGRGQFSENDESILNGYLGKFENILKLKELE